MSVKSVDLVIRVNLFGLPVFKCKGSLVKEKFGG